MKHIYVTNRGQEDRLKRTQDVGDIKHAKDAGNDEICIMNLITVDFSDTCLINLIHRYSEEPVDLIPARRL
jgi:hypothetical protein